MLKAIRPYALIDMILFSRRENITNECENALNLLKSPREFLGPHSLLLENCVETSNSPGTGIKEKLPFIVPIITRGLKSEAQPIYG